MKRIVILMSLFFGLIFAKTLDAQTVKEVFYAAYPELKGALKITPDTKYDPAKKDEYRTLFYKLEDGLQEIKSYEIGAASPETMKHFDYKDLKRFDKDGKLDSLKLLINQNMDSISDLMRYERWGADSIKAVNTYMAYRSSVKSKNMDDAYKYWTILFHQFPKSTVTIYSFGDNIMRYKIKKETDSVKRQLWIDTLMMIYDRRMELYPDQKLRALSEKAVDYHNFLIKGHDLNDSIIRQRIVKDYDMAKEAIGMGGLKTPYTIYPIAMKLSYFMLAMKKIDPVQFLDDYLLYTDNLTYLYQHEKNSKKKAKISAILKMVNEVFSKSPLSSCDKLEAVLEPKIDSLSTDPDFLKKSLTIMSKAGCTDSEVFEKAAVDLYKVEPSAEAAYNVFRLLVVKEKYDEAAKYIDEAIKQATVDTVKAKYYFDAARNAYKRNLYSQARTYARKAIELKPNWGEPYILIATMYAASANSCGTDKFEKSAVYWVAVDKLLQAKNVDPSVTDKVNELIASYASHYPNKEDGFMHGVYEGDTYTVGCWINETTKVRYNK